MNEAQVWIIGKQPYRKKQSAVILIDFHCIDICSEAKKQKKEENLPKQLSFLNVIALCIYMSTMFSRLHKIGGLSC